MKSSILLTLLFISGGFYSCHTKVYKAVDISKMFMYVKKVLPSRSRIDEFGNTAGEKVLVFSNGESKENWTIYQSKDKQIEFNAPSAWKLKEREEGILVFLVGDTKETFSLLAYDKAKASIDLDKYAMYAYTKMSSDTSWEFLSNDVKKMYSDDKFIYAFSWKAKKGETIFEGYSYFLDDDKNIYDFTYKNDIEKIKPSSKPTFDVVVGSFVFNGVLFFSDRFSKVTRVSVGIDQ